MGSGRTTRYRYDSAGRLTSVRRNGTLWRGYSYDQNGNRTEVVTNEGRTTAAYDERDRLTRYGRLQYRYRPSGELTSISSGRQTTRLDYDPLGNLRGVRLPDGRRITYDVDGLGRRVGKRVNGKLVQGFLYLDDLRPVAELDGQGHVVSRFIYAGDSNVPAYVMREDAKLLPSSRISSAAPDSSSTPRQVSRQQRLDYDPYGVVLTDTNPGFQPFGFAGGLYDPDTGLVRFGARDYDARTQTVDVTRPDRSSAVAARISMHTR